MTAVTPSSLRWLRIIVILYMLVALLAGVVAIVDRLPAEFGGSRTGLSVTRDFLYGMGTAISPPFYTLVIQLGLLLLTRRNDGWGTVGVLGLVLIGLMTCFGALGEPINRRIFNPATFDPLQAALMAGMILLPVAIVILGLVEWRRRSRE